MWRRTESHWVILVQVNPGEAFTIQREDGHCQCITGPAQVPMMSPNGSVPPIYVPTGYVSQIIEENGVRRVLVIPQPDFLLGAPSALHHPPPPLPPHLPAFLPHPVVLHPSPHPVFSGGAGDLAAQYMSHYQTGHVFSEIDSYAVQRCPPFAPRDDRAGKTYGRLQKKLKERQGGGGSLSPTAEGARSPSPSPQKAYSTPSPNKMCNGGQGAEAEKDMGQDSERQTAWSNEGCKGGENLGVDVESEALDEESLALQAALSTISKPKVTDVQARTALLSWSAPIPPDNVDSGIEVQNELRKALSYEVIVSCGDEKDGMYHVVYRGDELSTNLEELRPATDYGARIRAVCRHLRGDRSEAVTFTTLSCAPDTPSAPWRTGGTKSTISLQWKAPCDNGSRIDNYVLQWDEGKGTEEFEQCYYGPDQEYQVCDLMPSSRYCFRVAAKNEKGLSSFSEVAEMFTSGGVPSAPPAPELTKYGASWLSVQWQPSPAPPSGDSVKYILEVDEGATGCNFQPRYDDYKSSCTIENLRQNAKYKVRVRAYNTEGKSNPSKVLQFTTCPGCPGGLSLRGAVLPTSFRVIWEPPNDDGGSVVIKYVLEKSADLNGNSWEPAYSGPAVEYLLEGLKPGAAYQTRVYCVSEAGRSELSDILRVQTPAVPPGPCLPPRVVGKPKARDVQLRWGPPHEDGGSAVTCYTLEMECTRDEAYKVVHQGPELDCIVTGLLPATSYSFRLQASNKAGSGPYSDCCEVITGPCAPEAGRAPQGICRSPTCVLVSWETPPCNGAPVTEFRLERAVADGSMHVCYSGPGTMHELRGLQPATAYYFRVQAVNAMGAGPFSETTSCQTPSSVPAAVGSIQALSEPELLKDPGPDAVYCPSSCLGLRWEAPCDHGAEIISYIIDLGERQPIQVGRITRYIIQHLQPDTSYKIRVQALNSLGAGPFSPTVKMRTRPHPPQPPRLECIAFSHQTLRLKWSEGCVRAAQSEILQYQLQMEDRNGRFICLYRGPCHTHKVQRLVESTSYNFRIQAFNDGGEGPFSDIYTFTTLCCPPAPPKAPRLERLNDYTCDVSWEAVPPMNGDHIIYTLQCMLGNTEFKQVYRGSEISYRATGLHPSNEYRFRVGAIRQCSSPPDLSGPYSGIVMLLPLCVEGAAAADAGVGGTEAGEAGCSLTDEQCAALILALFAVTSILIAVVIQHFVIK
ncbi:fibronectin type-III domain-containing protein 3A isoform X2 [Brienomyrus brachyistius]|uniref:fibronectin type-III domain-containing protein 3A isoform X2 n=1 Tax=Brienomyrus brachyistius TaxID=42636 RepID=UPI0020B39679|nr:fibronectin type-III domain-containing protein 3A isoform X2 [Brienomyrus brachyistius]